MHGLGGIVTGYILLLFGKGKSSLHAAEIEEKEEILFLLELNSIRPIPEVNEIETCILNP